MILHAVKKMKNIYVLLSSLFIVTATALTAQELGEGSVNSSKASQATEWQNWTVAGGSLVAATVGVIVVATNSSSTSHHH